MIQNSQSLSKMIRSYWMALFCLVVFPAADIDGAKAHEQAESLGDNAAGHQVDVTDSAAVKLMIEAATERFGALVCRPGSQ